MRTNVFVRYLNPVQHLALWLSNEHKLEWGWQDGKQIAILFQQFVASHCSCISLPLLLLITCSPGVVVWKVILMCM